MTISAPDIITERLILRAHRAEDFDACVALWQDPDVIPFIGGTAFTPSAVWSRLLRYAGLWPVLGYGYWAFCDRQTGEFLGEGGLADFKREITPPLGATPESGWALTGAAQGRGLATEAMTAILDWADLHLDQAASCCIIDDSNTASVRVAEKLGYKADGTGQLGENTVGIYRRARRMPA